MEEVERWVDQFLPIVVHSCSERCQRSYVLDGDDEVEYVCRVPYNPPSADTWFDVKTYSSMSYEAEQILRRYGTERTAYKGVYKYRASTSKFRMSPQIPLKTWAIESNCNVLACDNQGNEHSYLIKYIIKEDQLTVWDHRSNKAAPITEANGQSAARAKNYSKPRYSTSSF